jgi:hypothetical protein
LIDIDWKNYSFRQHVAAVKNVRPFMTVVRDVERESHFPKALTAAELFLEWVEFVIVVPKFANWTSDHERLLTCRHIVGYSVPTQYGGTRLDITSVRHPVHLLGGRPDTQRKLAELANVVSIDCNRFTLDASFGDFFDGKRYNYARKLNYRRCLLRSMRGIERAWSKYRLSREGRFFAKRWQWFKSKMLEDDQRSSRTSLLFAALRRIDPHHMQEGG